MVFGVSLPGVVFGICNPFVTAASEVRALTCCYYWLLETECYMFEYQPMAWRCSYQVSWNSIVFFESLDGKLSNHAGRVTITVWRRKGSGQRKLRFRIFQWDCGITALFVCGIVRWTTGPQTTQTEKPAVVHLFHKFQIHYGACIYVPVSRTNHW